MNSVPPTGSEHAPDTSQLDDMPDQSAGLARIRVSILAVCGACVAVPFLVTRFLPIADLPQHVAQVRLFAEALQNPQGPYEIQWFTPYGLAYGVIGAAFGLTSPESAGRVAALVIALAWIGAIHLLSTARGRSAAGAALASVAVFNHTLYWGFLSFAVGWPVFVGWFLLTTGRRAYRITWLDALALLAGASLLYFSHALWFAVGTVWFVVVSLALRVPTRIAILRLLSFSPVLIAAALWYPRLTARGFDSATLWFSTPTARLSFSWLVDAGLGGLRGPTEYLVLAVILAWVATGVYQHRHCLAVAADRELWLAALVFFVLILLLPDKHTNTIAFASRWTPIALVLLILGAPTPRWSTSMRYACAIGVLLAFTTFTAVAWTRVEREEFSGLAESLAALPENPRVLGLDFVQESSILTGRPFLQTFAYAQALRGGELNFSFADFAPSPVVYKVPRRPPWTGGLEWFPDRVAAADLRHFDHALINGTDAMHQAVATRFAIAEIAGHGRWRLYRLPSP